MGGAAYPGGSMAGVGGVRGGGSGVGGFMVREGRWWEAFGTGGFEGEPGLIEGNFISLE
jgi:hypothetical protein